MSRVLTLIANRQATSLTPARIARAADALAGGTPIILSNGEAADIPLTADPDLDAVRAALDGSAIDAIVVKTRGRRKGLLIADMDSTIITGETLDELAGFAGLGETIAAITARAMNGEIDFKDALRERMALLKGLSLDALEQIHEEVVSGLSETDREQLLRGLSDAFATGRHSAAGETRKIAHLIAAGGHRHANAWLDSLDPEFAQHLTHRRMMQREPARPDRLHRLGHPRQSLQDVKRASP